MAKRPESAPTLLTPAQVAERLGITPNRVQQLIRAGRLPAHNFGRYYLVDPADLRLIQDRSPGRPPKTP